MSRRPTWTDSEWKQWREAQAKATPAPKASAPATSSQEDGVRNLRFELPDQWRIQPHSAPPGSNTMHGPKDFAGVVRSSNRMLKRMFNEWQTEVESIKETHASQLNLETVQSTQVLMEKNRSTTRRRKSTRMS